LTAIYFYKFCGHIDRDYVVDSVPHCLVELVSMIEHGPDIKSQIENGLAKSDFALAQLLYFNSHKKGTKNTSSEYFSADNFTCFSKMHGISIVTGRNKCWSNIFFKNQ
jgi:hypothetical protein